MLHSNNNTNTQDNIYGSVVIARVLYLVHLMNVEQRQVAADPQTKPIIGCDCQSVSRLLLSTTTIAVVLILCVNVYCSLIALFVIPIKL